MVDEHIGGLEADEDVRKEMVREWCRAYYRRAWAILVHALTPDTKAEEDMIRLRVIDDSRWQGEPTNG